MTLITVGYPGTDRRESVTAASLHNTLLLICNAVIARDTNGQTAAMRIDIEDTPASSQTQSQQENR